MNITIDPQLTPVFAPIGPLCQYTVPPVLPVTSINGVSGTWSPDTISTTVPGTFTFIFTPDTGQCALTDTMGITIDPQIDPLFDLVSALCQNSIPPPLPDTSLNGVTGTWDPDTISTVVPGTFTFIFTPDTGQCATVDTLYMEIGD